MVKKTMEIVEQCRNTDLIAADVMLMLLSG